MNGISRQDIGNEPTVGLWMYSNGGGAEIQQQIVEKLNKKNIKTVTNLDLANANARGGEIDCNGRHPYGDHDLEA